MRGVETNLNGEEPEKEESRVNDFYLNLQPKPAAVIAATVLPLMKLIISITQ